jgi:hypothetical protein
MGERVGDNAVMKLAACMALFASLCLAQEIRKPACNAKTEGQFWPEEANSSQEAVRRFSQSGELEVCSAAGLKHKWKRLSVNVHDLAKGKKSSSPPSKKPSPEESK